MAILAPPDSLRWKDLVRREEDTGEIPLPAVESIVLHPGKAAKVVLVDRDLVPGAVHVFARVEQMMPEHRLTLEGLLVALEHETDIRPLVAIYHLGGLDYSFCAANAGVTTTLRTLPETVQPVVWSLLNALALLAAYYPDIQASTPKSAHRA